MSDHQLIDESRQSSQVNLDEFLEIRIYAPFPGMTLVRLTGEVDLLTAPRMGERISEQIRRSPQVVVDMDGVNYLGSSCLSEMVWLHKQAAERGTQLHWAGAKDSVVARPLAITGLSRVLAIHSAPADAVVAGLRLGHLLDHGAGAEPRRAVTA